MIKNYFKVTLRNLLKYKIYSSINILGLGIAVAAAIIIALFANNELTYDQFHKKVDRIFMVYKERVTPNGVQPTYDTWVPLLDQLMLDYPDIESGARLVPGQAVVEYRGERFDEPVVYVDSSFFDVFTFPLQSGSNKHPFTDKYSVVLTQELATKYFGGVDPIGKTLQIDYELTYTVSGVLEDIPANSSIELGMVLPIKSIPQFSEYAQNWGGSFLNTYILLKDQDKAAALTAKFPELIEKIWDEETRQRTNFKLLPAKDFYNTLIGDTQDAYILIFVAIGLIVIASINFMNLSTARALERAKEVGIRKTIGAARKQLIGQFMSEAIITSLCALLVALLIAEAAFPFINSTFNLSLSLDYQEPLTLFLLVGFAICLGLISGSYPSFFLSGFGILDTLKGAFKGSMGSAGLRNVLVVAQFSISVILIIGALVVWDQVNYMKRADMGFEKDNLVVIPVSAGDFRHQDEADLRLKTFRDEVSTHAKIVSVSSSAHIPTQWTGSNLFARPEGFEGNPLRMRYTYHDATFFDTYGVALLEGDGFLDDSHGSQRESAVINEAAMAAFGWEDVNDKYMLLGSDGSYRVKVVGLIKDFNFETLQADVAPIVHFHREASNRVHRYITVKTSGGANDELFAFLESKWDILDPTRPFDYFFVDQNVAQLYEAEDRLLTMISMFSIVTIFVAGLGLFGLTSFTVEKRKKEIGVRKVLGASVTRVVVLISKRFITLVVIGFAVGVPISWYFMNEWLSGFAFHVDQNPLIYFITLMGLIVLAWVALGYKTIQAGFTNPVDVLRDE